MVTVTHRSSPLDVGSVKAVRYEDAANGAPPLPVTSLNQPPHPHSNSQQHQNYHLAQQHQYSTASKPRSLPESFETANESILDSNAKSPRSHELRASARSKDGHKRDSGIAPSISPARGTSQYTDSSYWRSPPPTAGTTAREPSVPTISVNGRDSSDTSLRKKSSFWRRGSNDKRQQAAEKSDVGIQRVPSFKKIEADIPTGDLDGFGLEDLRSDEVHFSNRGSLFLGGKKMNELINAHAPPTMPTSNHIISQYVPATPPKPATPTKAVRPMVVTPPTAPDSRLDRVVTGNDEPSSDATTPPPPKKGGLVSGRRKPSVQMLQAALQGGRVLSAEEISFSLKVRSMYEYGDERAADWNTPVNYAALAQSTPDNRNGNTSSPETSPDSNHANNTQDPTPSSQAIQARYSREAQEIAGGIEDWQDVDGLDVDRYGFIDAKRVGTRASNGSHIQGDGMHRVATSLRMETEQPQQTRLLRRGRSARTTPVRNSGDGQPSASMRSFKTSRSVRRRSIHPFQSRDRKAVSSASDMLHAQPGFQNLSDRDGIKTKKREYTREQKWQSMARSVAQSPGQVGGGMHFEFDTSDPKLVDRTWKGIPHRWRATAWYSFLLTSAKRRGSYATDEELTKEFFRLQEMSSADDVQIDVDVPRTINMHIMFRRRYRGGQRLLFRVLHAISLYFPDTGYVQGMACLAATLLCYYDEEKAFIMMTRLWQLRGLEQLFQNGFDGLMTALKDFEDDWLVKDVIKDGVIKKQLEDLCISSTAYGTRWYLTLFNMSVPFPAQLRVWDVFMLLGDAAPHNMAKNAFGGADLDVLHATSKALIDALHDIILESDFENAMKVLTSFVPIQNDDCLMRTVRAEWNMRKKRG